MLENPHDASENNSGNMDVVSAEGDHPTSEDSTTTPTVQTPEEIELQADSQQEDSQGRIFGMRQILSELRTHHAELLQFPILGKY